MKLERRAAARIMLALLLTSMFVFVFNVHFAGAFGIVYIRANGSVEPSTAPIHRYGDTYTLTDNITNSIAIQKDNIVFDGAGHSAQGRGDPGSVGIGLSGRKNVTVINTRIVNFQRGFWLTSSVYNNISRNKIESGIYGATCMHIASSSNYNVISANDITGNKHSGGILIDSSSNNSIRRNEIRDSNWGIGLQRTYLEPSSKYNNISENNIANSEVGIALSSAVGSKISGNKIIASFYAGIFIFSLSEYNSISGNSIIANNPFGMYIEYASGNIISGNAFVNNGLFVSDFSQNSVENNTVNGKPLVYLAGVADYNVGDAGQVILIRCDRIRVTNLNLSGANVGVELLSTNNSDISWNNITANSYSGIYAFSSSNNNINGNDIANNTRGIWLKEHSKYNRIDQNNITGNSIDGIQLFYRCSNNSIRGNEIRNNFRGIHLPYSILNEVSLNNIADNTYGIRLDNSILNTIYHNNFINNTSHVSVHDSINILDNDYPSGGNYWSNYNGTDLKNGPNQDVPGSDGIYDVPYVALSDVHYDVDTYNRDRYPLVRPHTVPVGIRDVALHDLTSSAREVAYTGWTVDINVTIRNKGDRADNRTITVYYDSHVIGSQTVLLAPSEDITLAFTWNTAGMSPGSYTLKAVASMVLAEANVTDNILTDSQLRIKILGDVNGDNKVDIRDLAQAAIAFGNYLGCPGWNPNTDLNQDGSTDIRDLVLIAKNFGKTYP